MLKFKHYCTEFRKIEFDSDDYELLLNNIEIIENNQATVLGLLFFGNNIEKYLPQAGIELNCFSGSDVSSDILDHKVLSNDIPSLIEAAEMFVKFNSRIQARFSNENIRRIDIPDYDTFVVRELIVNAFTHRDWSIFGQKIRLNMFEDRFELFSPGSLPNTLNIEKALNGISYYRNPVISQMLRDYKLSEKMGRGLYKINKLIKNKKVRINFEIEDNYFKVIVYKNSQDLGVATK